MNLLEFMIQFITPLLIHGADSGAPDSIVLTGKALRGCWRFWFRAMVGGMVKNISKEKLLELESMVFGSSDENVGAKFRVMVKPLCYEEGSFPIKFSRRTVSFKGFKEGCKFMVRILPRKNLKAEEQKVLLATIWLWANLGAIGQRARRGFGSPVVLAEGGDNPFQDLNLPVKQEFDKHSDLEEHLKKGLKNVWDVFNGWKEISSLPLNPSINASGSTPPTNPQFFIIQSFKQIAVANNGIGSNVNNALGTVHGKNSCHDMGSAIPRRMASPVFIRLHKINGEFYPVVTWSGPKNNGCARDYIYNNCKCTKYLDGSNV